MKRVISLILVLAMLTGVMPVRAAAEEQPETQQTMSQEETTGQTVSQEETTEQTVPQQETTEETAAQTQPEETAPNERTWEDFRYVFLADGSACICGFDGTPEKKDEPFLLEVPESIQGAAVTEIAEGAFAGNDTINALLLPKTLKTVGSGALEGCENLKVIAFCGEEPSFGESLAKDCHSLEEIFLLKDRDFSALTQLLEKDLGEEASRKAEYRSFENADALEAAFDALAVVPEPAPSDETADTPESQDPVLPDSITAASTLASGTCGDNLTWVLSSDGVLTISGEGDMTNYSASSAAPWYEQKGDISAVVIQAGVTSIGDSVFWGCRNLTSIDIPAGVTSIGGSAFSGCSSLTSIDIPAGVTSIGDYAFRECSGLTSIVIPAGVTCIGCHAFYKCSELTSVVIPFGVTSIRDATFLGCSRLASVDIPAGVTSIGNSAFYGCSSLTSIDLPSGVTSIGPFAFSGSGLTSIVIPSGVTSIGIGAFRYCSSLTSIVIPDSVTIIGDAAFRYCSNLTSIGIPAGVTSIDQSTFDGCSSLTTVTIPVGVTLICTGAFDGCPSITDVYYEGSEAKWNEIDIRSGNEDLLNATIHFNGSIKEATFQNHKYSVHDLSMTWTEAKEYCENLGGHLVTITSAEEQAFIESLLPEPYTKKQYWLGATSESGEWVWVTNEVFEYANWGYNQPDHQGYANGRWEEYAEIFNFSAGYQNRYTWNDIFVDNVAYGNPVVGADVIGFICEYDPDESLLGDVRYFREWDADKQIAYWGEFDYVGSQVTGETDITFLDNLDGVLDHYVLVQTKKRDDNLTAPDTILSIKPVDAKVGVITSMDQGLEIDNVRYKHNVNLGFFEVGDKVRYYLYNGVVVGELTLILPADETSNKPDYGSGNWETFPPADPADSYLLDYIDEWNKAYENFMKAAQQAMNDYAGKALSAKEKVIAKEAQRMKDNDKKSYSRYISGDLGEYTDMAYLALATFFYEYVDKQGIDFSSVDLSSKSAEANIVNAVLKGITGGSEVYIFQNVSYEINAIAIGSAFGSMTITDSKKGVSKSVIICSRQSDCNETTSEFLKDLRDLSTNASSNVISALCKDIFGKNITELTKKYLTDVAEKIERRFAVTLSGIVGSNDINGLFKKSGVGNFFETLDKCYTYYDWTKKAKDLLKKADSDPFAAIDKLKDIKFEDTSIKNGSVKKAMSALNTASSRLNTALNDYVSGTLVEKEEGLLRQIFRQFKIKCPVAVKVFNSSGEQIGYVDDTEIWYTDDLVITRNGHAKRIAMLTDDIPTLVVTATDYGTMNCSFEEYDESHNPIGRLNFFDISLSPEKEFSVAVRDGIDAYAEAFVITSGSNYIFADEYIPAELDAGVAISCDIVGADNVIVNGTGMYVRGDSAALGIETPDGYEFLGWFEGENVVSEDPVYELTAKEDRHFTAKFCKDENVSIHVMAFDGGMVIGGGRYRKGVTANLIAIPYNGYIFKGWYIGEEAVSEMGEYSIVANEDLTLAAKFIPHEHAYSEPEFVWTDDNYTCSAKFICLNCGYENVVDCFVTRRTIPASEAEASKIVYTATAEFNGQTYADTREVPEPVVRIAQDYLALSVGDSVKLGVKADSEVLVDIIRWSAEGPDGESAEAVISVDDSGTVTARGSGTAYVVASVSVDGVTYSDRCRVDVVAADGTEQPIANQVEISGVTLPVNRVTVELYSTQYTRLSAVLNFRQNAPQILSEGEKPYGFENQGAAISAARFTDGTAEEYFTLRAADDRTLEIIPSDAALAAEGQGKLLRSYTSSVEVTVQGQTFTTEPVTVTLRKTRPALKAESVSFNGFYPDQSQTLRIQGATVTGIQAAEMPGWLSLSGDQLTLQKPFAGSASGKLTLLVTTKEWTGEFPVTLGVKLTTKAPGLKLSATSLTFAQAYEFSQGIPLRLQCKDRKDTLEGLQVSDIQAPEGFRAADFDTSDGSFRLVPTQKMEPGKKILLVSFRNTGEQLPITINVSVKPVTLTAKPTSVTLNSVVGDRAFVTVTPKPGDFVMNQLETLLLTDSAGRDASSELTISYGAEGFRISTNARTLPGTVYKLSFSAGGSKQTTVTIKTLAADKSVPSMTLKTSGTVDLSFPDSGCTVTPVFRNYYGGLCKLADWSVTASRGKTELGDVTGDFTFGRVDGQFRIAGKTGAALDEKNTYTLTMTLTLGSGSSVTQRVKLPVKRTAVGLKLSKTSLSLNKTVGDRAEVAVSCTTKGYAFTRPLVSLMDGTGKVSAEGCLDLSWGGGKLTVSTNEATQYGASYRLLLRATEQGKVATLTVKIPTREKSGVTASLTARGGIDVIRDGSAITLRPVYKNCGEVARREEEIRIFCSADQYTQPVTGLFDIRRDDQGGFVVTKAPGAELDRSRKYTAVLYASFGDVMVTSAPAVLKLGMGSAKLSLTPVEGTLLTMDRNSRTEFSFARSDSALNAVARVRIKDAKYRELFQVYVYGNGRYALGFLDGKVDNSLLFGKTSFSIPLEVFLEGNTTDKANTTVNLKLRLVTCRKTTKVSIYAGVSDVSGETLEMDTDGGCVLTVRSQPAGALEQYTWVSSDEGVATMDPETGIVYPQGPGTAVLTCTAADGSKQRASVTVKVSEPVLTDLSINRTYCLGDTLDGGTLMLKAVYQSGIEKQVLSDYTCTPAVLDTAGTQSVTVSYGGLEKTFEVEVLDFYELSAQVENISGEGYNEDGRVSWVLYVTGRYTGNYTAFSSRNDLPISTGRPVEFAEAWTDALNGQGGRWGYCCSDRGYGEYHGGCGFTLPDDPELAGRYQVSLSFGDVSKTASFTLVYEGDYTTGTGWSVSDVSWS